MVLAIVLGHHLFLAEPPFDSAAACEAKRVEIVGTVEAAKCFHYDEAKDGHAD